MLQRIRSFLKESNLDALLFIGNSLCDPDIYYLSRFLTTDRFTLLVLKDRILLLVSSMEKGRACKESCANEVISTSDYDIMDKLKNSGKPDDVYIQVLREFLHDQKVKRLGIPFRFPAGVYRHLCRDFDIAIEESPVSRWRAVKKEYELDAIRSVQKSCDIAMHLAIDIVCSSSPKGDILFFRDQPLTSEQIRSSMELALLNEGCEAVGTIVAGGMASADPHARGTGTLPANAPIVIDIFPRSKNTRYFADMTRTVVRGEASPEIKDIYEAVLQAQITGLKAIKAGASGKEIHSQVCSVFEEHGYPGREGRGFTHSTGHGVGLDIHERPSLSEAGEILETNNVVTVEPGLYYPEIGGVRLEDLVVVTEQGFENLTDFEKRLII